MSRQDDGRSDHEGVMKGMGLDYIVPDLIDDGGDNNNPRDAPA